MSGYETVDSLPNDDQRRVLFRVVDMGHPPLALGGVHAEDYMLTIQWVSTGHREAYHISADPMTVAPGSIMATTNFDSLWQSAQEAARSGMIYWTNLDFSGPNTRLSDTVPDRLLQAIHNNQTAN
jgi:hypothetical protein